MDQYDRYTDENGISIDSILAEYGTATAVAEPVREEARERVPEYARELADEDDVKEYRPRSGKSSRPTADEIRSYVREYSRAETAESVPEEAYEAYAPEAESRVSFDEAANEELPDGYDDRKADTDENGEYNPITSGGIGYELNDRPIKKKKTRRERRLEKRNAAFAEEEARFKITHQENDEDFAASFRDYGAAPADYAPEGEYDAEAETFDNDRDEEIFPSFKEYVASLVTSLLFSLRLAHGGSATMEDSDEDLGAEVKPMAASKYYGSFVRSLRLRTRISGILMVLLVWISAGLPLPGMLNDVRVAALMCLGVQLTIMLLSVDVVSNAIMNAVRLKPGADSLAVISCILSAADALLVAMSDSYPAHLPLCVLSSLSLMGVLLSSLLSSRGLRKTLRVPAIAKKTYTVTGEVNIDKLEITLLKSTRPITGFVRRSEEAAPDETLYVQAAPFILGTALILTVITTVIKHALSGVLYIFSALLAPAIPFTALIAFALPFFIGAMRIFPSGAAIAGWSGVYDIGSCKNIIITDIDLFPEGSVAIKDVRIVSSSEKVIAYAGSMIAASGSSIASCFSELMAQNNCAMRTIDNFEYLPGGGMQGLIDGERVLCGSTELMRLMNVRVPFRLVDDTAVLLAIDGILYGIFNMDYQPQNKVRSALVALMRSDRHPVFALRDFNITPALIRDKFDVPTDGYDFPPYIDRFRISSARPSEDSKIAALVCREGLGPLINTARTGRRIYLATRINMLITMLGGIIGMLTVFIKLMTVGTVSTGFLTVFMLLWAAPVLILSVFWQT